MNRSLKLRIFEYTVLAIAFLPAIYVLGWDRIVQLWNSADTYHVSRPILLALFLGTTPPYYWSGWLIAKSATARDWSKFGKAVLLNRAIWAPPWVYVFVVGSGYPWWVRPAIILWVVVAVIILVTRALSKKSTPVKGD